MYYFQKKKNSKKKKVKKKWKKKIWNEPGKTFFRLTWWFLEIFEKFLNRICPKLSKKCKFSRIFHFYTNPSSYAHFKIWFFFSSMKNVFPGLLWAFKWCFWICENKIIVYKNDNNLKDSYKKCIFWIISDISSRISQKSPKIIKLCSF
jgi:hypothetical protein